jgi:hypothetical protein
MPNEIVGPLAASGAAPPEGGLMAHMTIDALLADHRFLEEVDAVTAAWDKLASAMGSAFFGQPDSPGFARIEELRNELAAADVRAQAELREALGILEGQEA